MANEEHIKRLKGGVAEWNVWRKETVSRKPDLSDADLYRTMLTDADLSGADLGGANLIRSDLAYADLTDARLTHAKLSSADLAHADLANAVRRQA